MVMMDNAPPFGFRTESDSSLMVLSVEPGGKAERAGIKAGWTILEFNGTSIIDKTHFVGLLAESKPKEGSDDKHAPVRFTFRVPLVRVWGRV